MEIYYFSGTGNSLHVAKELAKKLSNTELIPLVSLLGKEKVVGAETVGFVFPIHMTVAPTVVKNFIAKLDLSRADYIFAVATRIGTQHSAFYEIDKVLKKKGKRLNAAFSVNMPSNDPKFNYQPLTDEEMIKLEAAAQADLKNITEIISKREPSRKKDANFTMRVPFTRAISWLAELTDGLQPEYYADEKCTGCGTCAKVCLSGKIKMADGRPEWQKEVKCFKCSACLNFCPRNAVQIRNMTEKNGRYGHPYATAEEVEGEKGKFKVKL
jgi:ferredoxin